MAENNVEYSVSPTGEKIPLPQKGEYASELARLEKLASPRAQGGQGNRGCDGRRIRRRGDGGHRGRHRGQERAAQQVRHRLPAAQHAQLLENRDAEPGTVAGESRRSRGGPDHLPLRAREEDADGHLQQRLPEARRLRRGGRAMRLCQAKSRRHAHGRGRHGRAGGDDAHHRRENPGQLSGAHRNHRRPGHHGIRGVADPEEGVCGAGHQVRAVAGPQFRAGHARPRIRGEHPRFLAGLRRLQRQGAPARREIPPRSAEHRGVSR